MDAVCEEMSNPASVKGIDWRVCAWIAVRKAARRLKWEYDIQALSFNDWAKFLQIYTAFAGAVYDHWLIAKRKEDPGFNPKSPFS